MVSLNNLDEQIGALEEDEEEDFEDSSVWDNPCEFPRIVSCHF